MFYLNSFGDRLHGFSMVGDRFSKTHSTLEPSLLVDEVVEIMLICGWSFYKLSQF